MTHNTDELRVTIKEQYRRAFINSIDPYELEEMDLSDINEVFEEVWADCAAEIYEFSL